MCLQVGLKQLTLAGSGPLSLPCTLKEDLSVQSEAHPITASPTSRLALGISCLCLPCTGVTGGSLCSPCSSVGSGGVNFGFHTNVLFTEPYPPPPLYRLPSFLFVWFFFSFCFCLLGVVETGFYYTALTGLELTM